MSSRRGRRKGVREPSPSPSEDEASSSSGSGDPLSLARQASEQAALISERQQTQLERLESLSQLKQKLAEVKARHGELQAELKRAQALATRTTTKSSTSDTKADQTSADDVRREMESFLASNIRRRKQALLSQAYSFAGITVLPFKDKRLLLVFGLSHEGNYYDRRYYIWLETDKTTNNLRVFKHTVPYYIPIKQLEDQYLSKNASHFIRALSKYFHAFTTRRSYAVGMSEQQHVQNVETSAAFDYISFSFQSRDYGSVQVALKYDLTRSKADAAVVTFLEPLKTAGKSKAAHESAARERDEWKHHLEKQMTTINPVSSYKQLFSADESVIW